MMHEGTSYEVYRLSTLDRGRGTRWVLLNIGIKSLEEAMRFIKDFDRDDGGARLFNPDDFRILSTCRRFEPYIEPSREED